MSIKLTDLNYWAYLPAVGMTIMPDGWSEKFIYGDLVEADEIDREILGASFRIITGHEAIPTLPVNIKITGRKAFSWGGGLRVRIKIEFVNEDTPSEFYGGWMILNHGDYTL